VRGRTLLQACLVLLIQGHRVPLQEPQQLAAVLWRGRKRQHVAAELWRTGEDAPHARTHVGLAGDLPHAARRVVGNGAECSHSGLARYAMAIGLGFDRLKAPTSMCLRRAQYLAPASTMPSTSGCSR